MNKQNIVFAGGGTGGHCKPIQSLIEFAFGNEEILENRQSLFWFGEKISLEKKLFEETKSKLLEKTKKNKLTFVSIFSGKFRREKTISAFLKNIKDLFLFVIGFFQSLLFLKKCNIGVIFCKGGYVALPVILAGKLLGLKIFTHESDTKPGIVNKISSKLSVKNFCGFPNTLPNSVTVGQILSEEITKFDKNLIKKTSNPVFLVIGGSQGSSSLYKTLQNIFIKNQKILEQSQFFIVGGTLNKNLKKTFPKHKNIFLYDFLSSKELGKLYFQSDIAITRAGTTTLEELNLFGIKKIIVPIPRTHDQVKNTKWYVKNFNDFYIDQNNQNLSENLENKILEHLNFKKESIDLKKVSKKITKAKEIIRKEILKHF